MKGVRLDRFLASTAIALFLCAGGAAWAGSSGDQDTPAATETTSPDADQAAASSEVVADPATDAAPASAAESTSAIPSSSTAAEPADQPATAAEQPAEPKAPTTADTPPADAKPAAAIGGGDEVPAPAASTSPSAAPNEPAAAAAPTTVADGNTAIAEKLRDLATGKFDRMLGGKKERAAFEAYYASRDYAPLWLTDGKPNARAQAAIAYLGHVDADGLDTSDYPTPSFASLSDPSALAEAELRLSLSISAYAHHAAVGRVHWSRVSGDIYYEPKVPAPGDVLAKVAGARHVSETLASYEPQSRGYLALKAKLAELRGGKEDAGQAPIPIGPALKIGSHDGRVAQLRQRLNVPGDDNTYDKALADAVKQFQQGHELKPTGLLTSATIDALNGRQPDPPIDTIVANMERWRWMPHELGRTYVMVNLPDFTLRVMQDGKELWETKIVDGKPNMPTPIMSAEMKYITVNPTWNVPPSIVAREYMPALQQDPTVLTRMGLSVSTNPDGTVHISQPPGEKNALGRLRFNFPNKFLVYQHDTPEKHLFAYDKRAFSHGCMRVQDPVKYAEVLLSVVRPREGYTEDRIRRMFGNNETDISFPNFIPVHLTYQTAFVDENGKLQFRDDVYGRDKVLLSILKSDERKVADTPIERKENTVKRELLAMPEQSGFFGGRGYPGGGDFFSRLFGPSADQAPVKGQRRRSAQTTDSNFSERWR